MLSSGHMLPIGHERWLEEVLVLVPIVAKGGSASADSWWLEG